MIDWFYSMSTLPGLFYAKVNLQLYMEKMYLHNQFKLLNTSYLCDAKNLLLFQNGTLLSHV